MVFAGGNGEGVFFAGPKLRYKKSSGKSKISNIKATCFDFRIKRRAVTDPAMETTLGNQRNQSATTSSHYSKN